MTTSQNKNPIRSLAKRVLLTAGVVALIMAIIAVAVGTTDNAVSVVIGSLVAIASFLVLVAVVVQTLGPSKWSKALVAGIGFLKLAILGAVLWWLVADKIIEPITFLAGFSSVVVALVIEGLRLKSAGCHREPR
ncbi:MAG: ATP synthase subunit I [Pseudomonadota bacterium]